MKKNPNKKKSIVNKAATVASVGIKVLNSEQRKQLIEVATDPHNWKKQIHDTWDWTKIEATETKDAFVILAKIGLGREISGKELKECASQLGEIGLLIPPLRLFSLPGSHHLLGIAAKITPWHLIPEISFPKPDLLSRIRGRDFNLESSAEHARHLLEDE